MHYHLEIIMPPTDDINAAITQIMAPFDENGGDETRKHAFWDWYETGGRWSGHKMLSGLPQDRIDAFWATLKEKRVTVSAVQAGKQSLQPADQAAMVDQMWREAFPDFPGEQCPLFAHYKGEHGDVCRLGLTPLDLKCERVIIAALSEKKDCMVPAYMISTEVWNGVTHVKTTWDGTVSGAIADFSERWATYGPIYRNETTPGADWLVVTIDYHS